MTVTLAEFLLARIAEEANVARFPTSGYEPEAKADWVCPWTGGLDFGSDVISVGDGPVATHMATWDPARVLIECEAKRRIVELHHYEYPFSWVEKLDVPEQPDKRVCSTCGDPDEARVPWPCRTLRFLALPYAAHPDYDPAWHPE